jgi:hypothetical protein
LFDWSKLTGRTFWNERPRRTDSMKFKLKPKEKYEEIEAKEIKKPNW